MSQLRGITWTNPRGYLPLVAASAVWEQARPGSVVHWEQFPWYEFEQRVLDSLRKQDGYYDLIMFDHPWTGTLSSSGWLTPWNDLLTEPELNAIEKRTICPSFQSYVLDGKLWALPLDSACHTGLYRADLISSHELPTDWDALRYWAQSYRSAHARYPLVLSVEGVLGSCLFLSMMSGLSHPAYVDKERPTCDRAAARHVLALLKSLLPYTPPGSHRWGPWDIYQRFVEGDELMYSPSLFAYVNYFGSSGRMASLKLAPVPAFASSKICTPILGGVGLGIASHTRSLTHAKQFGQFLMSTAVQSKIFPQHSGQPSDLNVWQDESLDAEVNHFYRDLGLGMRNAYIRPRYAGFHEVELQLGKALQQWWEDKATLQTTIERICANGG